MIPYNDSRYLLVIHSVATHVQVRRTLHSDRTAGRTLVGAVPSLLVQVHRSNICASILGQRNAGIGLFTCSHGRTKIRVARTLPPSLTRRHLTCIRRIITARAPFACRCRVRIRNRVCSRRTQLVPLSSADILTIVHSVDSHGHARDRLGTAGRRLRLILGTSSRNF